MANYQNLLDSIAAVIKTNGNEEITGAVLQSTLQSMVSVLGANATYGGVAETTTNPGTPDGAVVYIAKGYGIFTNFSAIEVGADELAVLEWNPTTGVWTKNSIAYIADKQELEDYLQDAIDAIDHEKDDAIAELNIIVQSVDVTYETISGDNVQLKNGSGDLLMPKTVTKIIDINSNLIELANRSEYYVNASNKWAKFAYPPPARNDLSYYFPLTKKGKYVTITTGANDAAFCFLKTIPTIPTVGNAPDFSIEHSGRIVQTAGTTQSYLIGDDMNFVFFNLYQDEANAPKSVTMTYDIEDCVNGLKNRYKEFSFKPTWITGNPLYMSWKEDVLNGQKIKFGSSEAGSLKYIHTPLYNVAGGSKVIITGGNSNIEMNAAILDCNYKYIKVFDTVRSAGDAWADIEIDIPTEGAMLAIDAFQSDGGTGYLTSLPLTIKGVFNSDKLTSFHPRPVDSGYQHLTMKVEVTDLTSNSYTPSNALQVESEYYPDHGILYLPENYDPNGDPVRLIVFTHGHAVNYNASSTRFNSDDIKPEYWASEGLAIMDMDGSVTGSFSGNHDYEPAAMNAYETAYQWVVAHYNVRRDGVFSTGRSQGGGMQFALSKSSTIPIIASAPMVCVGDPLGYVGIPITGAQRKALLAAYGVPSDDLDAVTWTATAKAYNQLTDDERNLIVANQWRLAPYTPGWMFNRPLTDTELTLYASGAWSKVDADLEAYYESVKDSLNVSLFRSVPFRIYTCVGDPTVYYKICELQHKLLTYAGANAQIHVFPACADHSVVNTDHRFEINPENLVNYVNSDGVTINNVPKVYIETLAFWRRFENQDSID